MSRLAISFAPQKKGIGWRTSRGNEEEGEGENIGEFSGFLDLVACKSLQKFQQADRGTFSRGRGEAKESPIRFPWMWNGWRIINERESLKYVNGRDG